MVNSGQASSSILEVSCHGEDRVGATSWCHVARTYGGTWKLVSKPSGPWGPKFVRSIDSKTRTSAPVKGANSGAGSTLE